MTAVPGEPSRGFTLIEVLTALLILSLLALMSYRGLGAVLDARVHAGRETDKWRSVASFFARFERDLRLAAPRPVRTITGTAPAWRGYAGASSGPRVEFSRFASVEGVDAPRRLAYGLNGKREIELWLWPGLDAAPDAIPARYAVLTGVTRFELQYLDANLAWIDAWPGSAGAASLPRAVRLYVVLASGEDISRIFIVSI